MSIRKINKKTYFVLFAIFGVLLLLVELFNLKHSSGTLRYELVYGTVARFLGSAISILLMSYVSYTYLFSVKNFDLRGFLFIIPCFIIAINNFPFVSIFENTVVFKDSWQYVVLYAVQCLLVGIFEETAFRGCVFMLLLEKRNKTRKDIFISIILSSLVFGAVHIANLIVGASPIPVLLQLGYSFLIGCMCAVVLLLTKNIWCPIIIHALYNFAGGVLPKFVDGFDIWTKGEVIVTVVVSIVIAVYTIVLFAKCDLEKMRSILKKPEKN